MAAAAGAEFYHARLRAARALPEEERSADVAAFLGEVALRMHAEANLRLGVSTSAAHALCSKSWGAACG